MLIHNGILVLSRHNRLIPFIWYSLISFYLVLRGIAVVDDVHDFVDFLVGEVFFAKAGAMGKQ